LALEDALSRDYPEVWLEEVAKTTDTFQENEMKSMFPKENSTLTETQLSDMLTKFDTDGNGVVEHSEMKEIFNANRVKFSRSFLEELKSSVRQCHLKTLTAMTADLGGTNYYFSGADQKETHERATWFC